MYTLAMKIGIYNLAASAVCPDYSKAVLNNKSPAKKEKNIGKTRKKHFSLARHLRKAVRWRH